MILSMSMLFALGVLGQSAPPSEEDPLLDAMAEIERLRQQNERIDADNADLRARLERLEARAVAEGAWLDEARAAEIRAIVTDTLADASTRSSLAADGELVGYDPSSGFRISSPDGRFTLGIRAQMQVRWISDNREIGDAPAAAGSPDADATGALNGFELRRVRLILQGSVVDPSWTYDIKLANTRASVGGITGLIDDAYIQKSFGDGVSVRVGQFIVPFLREDHVSGFGQLAVERSLVTAVFGVGRAQGLQFGWTETDWRFEGFFGDALRAVATAPGAGLGAGAAGGVASSVNTSYSQTPVEYAFAGRIEWKPTGEWKHLRELSSFRSDDPAVLFGLAGYVESLKSTSSIADPDIIWSASADATVELGGASVAIAGVYRWVELASALPTRDGGSSGSLGQWGASLQGGYFITENFELFARYEIGSTDTDKMRTAPSALSARGELLDLATVGFNWWPAGSSERGLKFSLDCGYAFEPLVDFASAGSGAQVDYTPSGGETQDGQWIVRSQLQLTF